MERYEFDSEGDRLVGNLHLPQGDALGVAILTGPLTSVKEQATGAWGSALAERGFAALSFDHRYFGESAGRPRQLENPAAKIADIQAATASLHSDRRFASMPISLSRHLRWRRIYGASSRCFTATCSAFDFASLPLHSQNNRSLYLRRVVSMDRSTSGNGGCPASRLYLFCCK